MKSNVVRIPDPKLEDHYLDVRLDVRYKGSEEIVPVLITLKTYREIDLICDFQCKADYDFDILKHADPINGQEPLSFDEVSIKLGEDVIDGIELIRVERNQFYYLVHNCCYDAKCNKPCSCSSDDQYIYWLSELKRLESLIEELDPYTFENSNPVSTP